MRPPGSAMLVALVLMSSCADAGPAVPGEADVRESLAGGKWIMTHVADRRVTHELGRCDVTRAFTDGTLGGQGVINGYGGDYVVEAGYAHAPTISAHMMGGDAESTVLEGALFAAVGTPFRLRRSGSAAVLVDAQGRTALRLQADNGGTCGHAR